MVIRFKIDKEIIWLIVVLYILQLYVLGPEEFFLCCFAVIGLYAIQSRRIIFPSIPGFYLYVFMLLFMTGVGATKYGMRLIVRDAFYEISSLAIIMLGYIMNIYMGEKRSLWKTVCLMGVLSSITSIISGFVQIGTDLSFGAFRDGFTMGIPTIGFLLPLLLGRKLVFRMNTFSPKTDNLIMIIWVLHMVLNLGRLTIINTIVGFTCILILGFVAKKVSNRTLKHIAEVLLIVIVGMVIFWRVMPSDATERLSEKFSNTFTEISAANEFDSMGEAQSDWRGYEINCAKKQWIESDVLEQLIGGGNGTLIRIKYVPDQWVDIMEEQNGGLGVTVLHNTYYTLLIKGGIIAVVLFLLLLLRNFYKGIKTVARSNITEETRWSGVVLAILSLLILINAYVVRTMFDSAMILSAMLLFGWSNAELNRTSRKSNRMEEC